MIAVKIRWPAILFPLCFSLSFSRAIQPIMPVNNVNNTFHFVENKGQFADSSGKILTEFQYKAQLPGVNAYIKQDGIMYHFFRSENKKREEYSEKDIENFNKGDLMAISKKVYFFRMDFKLNNANLNAKSESFQPQQKYYNYYLGHCPNGILNVKSYAGIIYKNVYPNIDLEYFFKDGNLKYEFIVKPGGKVSDISFSYDGAKSLSLENGRLNIENDYSSFSEETPIVFYQNTDQIIRSRFETNNRKVSFNLENYDKTKTVVIDPTVTWATYFNNAYSSDFHCNSARDASGNYFTAFATYGGTWTTINAGGGQYYDNGKNGITDLVIVRFNSNYSEQWATYYGGSDGEYLMGTGGDYGKSIAVDANGDVYFGGYCASGSTDFPTQSSGVGGAFYQSAAYVYGGDNLFFVKLNGNGVRQWATIFQHEQANTNGAGMFPGGLCASGSKLYFTGHTYKFNSNNVPLRSLSGAYNQSTFVGDQDPFVGRFNSDCVLEWCTYLNGGNTANKAYKNGSDVSVDASGNLLWVGQFGSGTVSSGYLLNPGGGAYYSGSNAGSYDVHIVKFNTSMVPTWATYYGGSSLDRVSEISSDASGNILVSCRMANGNGMPTANPGGAFYYTTRQSSSTDGFIMKFTSGGALYWATYVGGTNNSDSSIPGISSDNSGNIYAIGYTNTTNFPTQNLSGSYNQSSSGGGMDLVLMKFTSGGVLSWSSYYGGTGSESCYGVKLNAAAGSGTCGGFSEFFCFSTGSADLPTTNPGSPAFYESTKSTGNANAILLLSEGSTSIPGGSTWTWNGSVSDNWHTACNWDKQSVPNSSSLVVIPGGTTNNPKIYAAATGDCYTISINSGNGGVITIDSGGGGLLRVYQP